METTTKILLAKDIKQKFQNNEDVILIDTLSKESFCAKRIPGSINIPTAEIKERVEYILPDKNQNLIVYCANSSCMKSTKAVEILTELGYKNVLHYPDGLAGWLKDGFKLVETGLHVDDEC